MIIEESELPPPVGIMRYRIGPTLKLSVPVPGGVRITEGQEHAVRIHVDNINSNAQAFGFHKLIWAEYKPLILATE